VGVVPTTTITLVHAPACHLCADAQVFPWCSSMECSSAPGGSRAASYARAANRSAGGDRVMTLPTTGSVLAVPSDVRI